jgi:hypothetical protein
MQWFSKCDPQTPSDPRGLARESARNQHEAGSKQPSLTLKMEEI